MLEQESLEELRTLNRNFERFFARQTSPPPGPSGLRSAEIDRLAKRTPEEIKADNKRILKEARERLKLQSR